MHARVQQASWPDIPPADTLMALGGSIIGLAHIYDCKRNTELPDDTPFKLFGPGYFCWMIDEVIKLHEPIRGVKGRLGLWEIQDEVVANTLRNQLPKHLQQ